MVTHTFSNIKIYPEKNLQDLVAYYWEIKTNKEFCGNEISVPDGYVNLLFLFNPIVRDQKRIKPDIYIVGPRTQKNEYSFFNEATANFGVCLVPTALKRLFGLNVSVLKNQVVELSQLDKKLCFNHSQFEETDGIEAKIKLVNTYLQAKESCFNDRYIASIINRIFYDHSIQSVQEICDQYRISAKQLYRSFTEVVGMSPIEFIRISRMNKFLHYHRNHQNFTSACYSAGYYDQSHFIKDFKKIVGCSPKKLFSTNSELLKILSSDIERNIRHLSSYSSN